MFHNSRLEPVAGGAHQTLNPPCRRRLVEDYPSNALSWFAVGCYYMCTRQFDQARRYFAKATSMDANFAEAWVAFGHAFAALDESDQAMAAYRTAARRFPGLHGPLLGMGLEYSRMNNLPLAQRLLEQAHKLCPEDPQVCVEGILGAAGWRGYQGSLAGLGLFRLRWGGSLFS